MKRTAFFYPEEMIARLKIARTKLKIPMSRIVRAAVDEYLKRMKL